MDNKNEKTFTDLFSSATENDTEPTGQTFADILNSSITEEPEEDSVITFDSIFDEAPEKEEFQTTPEEPLVEETINLNNNLFFDNEIEENTKLDIVEEKEELIPEITTEAEIDTNPFFKKETETPKEEPTFDTNPFITEENVTIEEPAIVIAPIFKEEKNNEISENPFFTKEEKKEEEKTETKPIIKEEPTTNEELITSVSPFFEEEKKEEENPLFLNKINLVTNQDNLNTNIPKSNINVSNTKHYNVKVVKKKESPLKFIVGVLSYALFILLLLVGITLLVYVLDIKIRAAKGDYSSPTFNAYVVLTGSMLPEIQVFDVVVTKKVEASKLEEGDVITFASADSRFLGTIITHRIIKKNPPKGNEGYTFQTRGDNNNVADNALVPENNIYGKVILKIPKLGYLQEFLASKGGWIIVILIPCLTVISYDVVKLLKGLKRKKYKNIKVQK